MVHPADSEVLRGQDIESHSTPGDQSDNVLQENSGVRDTPAEKITAYTFLNIPSSGLFFKDGVFLDGKGNEIPFRDGEHIYAWGSREAANKWLGERLIKNPRSSYVPICICIEP